MLGTIRAEIEQRSKATRQLGIIKKDKAFFDEAYALLDSVRDAWRNSTMDVENGYAVEEAHHIWIGVRGLGLRRVTMNKACRRAAAMAARSRHQARRAE
jgi:hypothetical protein